MAARKSKTMKLVEEASAGKTGGYARTDNGKSESSVSRKKKGDPEEKRGVRVWSIEEIMWRRRIVSSICKKRKLWRS